MTSLKIWLSACRPKTLPASLAATGMGLGLAFLQLEQFHWPLAWLTLATCLSLQVAVNLANDYSDAKRGIDSVQRLGPTRATANGLISTKTMRQGIFVCLLAAMFLGLAAIFAARVSLLIFLPLGLISIAASLAYSGGPKPLASHALGELLVFIFFGPVAVIGSFYLQTHAINSQVVIFSVATGCAITAIMLVNNVRDGATDQQAGKITLAVHLGQAISIKLYMLLILLPALTLGYYLGQYSVKTLSAVTPLMLISALALYLMGRSSAINPIKSNFGEYCNRLLAQTAFYALAFTVVSILSLSRVN